MKSTRVWNLCFSLCLLGALVLGGCSQDSKDRFGIGERKPAGSAPKAGKPAPAPAVGKASIAIPAAINTRHRHLKEAFVPARVILEKAAPEEVNVGQEFEYTITATNKSNLGMRNVVVRDALPKGFELISSTPEISDKKAIRLGELGPGQAKTITIRGKAAGAGALVNCATVTFQPFVCVTTNVVSPSLKLTKVAPATVLLCDPIPLKLTVTNTGTGMARNVRVTDTLPKGLVTDAGSNQISLNAGNLASGQSRDFMVNLKALDRGEYLNKATAAADGGLEATASTRTVVVEPVLGITKTGPQTTFVGRNATYNVTVKNTGDGPAENAVIEDILPVGSTFVSATGGGQPAGGKVVWNVGTIPVNGSKQVSVTVKTGAAGSLTNRATASARCAKAVSATAATSVTGIPAILLEVVDVQDPVLVGANETYIITVTNQGTAPGKNIRIVAKFEEAMQHVSSGGATSSSVQGRTITFAPLPTLAPKAKATWRITAKALAQADHRFKFSLTSDQSQRPIEETESTNLFK